MNIDSSYFTEGRRHILNAMGGEGITPNSKSVNTEILSYINQYSSVFLVKVLSADLAKRMIENDGSDEQLKDLFEGLKEPLADFVMYHILRYSGQQSTINGAVELKSGNTLVSPARYQADIWNEMVDGLRGFCQKHPEMRVDQCLLTKITSCWI